MIDNFDLVILFSHMLEMLIGNMFYSKVFNRRYNNIIHYCAYTSIYLVVWILFEKGALLLNLFSTIIFNCLIINVLFKGKMIYKIYYSLYYCISLFLTEIIGLNLIKTMTIFEYVADDIIIHIVISKIILLSMILITLRFIKVRDKQIASTHVLVLIFLSLSNMLIYFLISDITLYNVLSNYDLSFMIIGSLGGMLLNLYSFYLLEEEIEKQSTIKEYELKEQKYFIETSYYNIIAEKYNQIKIIQHDTNKHLSALKYYIDYNHTQEASDYLDNLLTFQNNSFISPITGNKLLDVILNEKIQIAKQKDISLITDLKDIHALKLSDVEITTVFSNILDNAIESCEKCEDKSIGLKIYSLNENLLAITVKNSCKYFSNYINGMLTTLKRDKERHGYGLLSVKKVIEKYGGSIEFAEDKENNSFTTYITLLK